MAKKNVARKKRYSVKKYKNVNAWFGTYYNGKFELSKAVPKKRVGHNRFNKSKIGKLVRTLNHRWSNSS